MKKFPIVFFAFKRPDKTKLVLTKILKEKPPKIYIFADGASNVSDGEKVDETRKVIDSILDKVPKKDVIKTYRKNNFGLKRNIIDGLNFVFKHEDAAIVLEDDCLPSSSFFDFCNGCLELYKDHKEIYTICGTNISKITGLDKAISSRFFVPWGWALWKRTWIKYMNASDNEILTVKNKKVLGFSLRWYLSEVYKLTMIGRIDTWDYKMLIMQIVENGYSLVPPFNTVQNIGFGAESSNTAFYTSASNLTAHNETVNLSKLRVFRYSKVYDSVIIKKVILTPVSMAGLLARKYFPVLTKQIYK